MSQAGFVRDNHIRVAHDVSYEPVTVHTEVISTDPSTLPGFQPPEQSSESPKWEEYIADL